MFHLSTRRNRFKIPVEEWNKVANFLTNLRGGFGINVSRPDHPSANDPPTISLDSRVLNSETQTEGFTTDNTKKLYAIKSYSKNGDEISITFQKLNFENGILKSVEDVSAGTITVFSADA